MATQLNDSSDAKAGDTDTKAGDFCAGRGEGGTRLRGRIARQTGFDAKAGDLHVMRYCPDAKQSGQNARRGE